jgi:hypothetical protein
MDDENQAILEKVAFVLPMVHEALNNEVGITLTDREKYLLYKPAVNLDLQNQVDASIQKGTGLYRLFRENLPYLAVRVEKELYGIPYVARVRAIYNRRGEIIGALGLTHSVERQETMKEMAANVLTHISTLASTAEEITAQSQTITGITTTLAKTAQESQNRVSETNQVLSFIKSIAGQTNLLGLNAAIEAARVGDHGRGFGVVAEEIRKLAASSTQSIFKIDTIIKGIQSDSAASYNQISEVEKGISQVAQAIAHLAGAAEELRELVHLLDKEADVF